ncbi:MAG: hypothetical protein RLZZ241_897 [Bacteroidota bacterium]|jgi:hypothetical protein
MKRIVISLGLVFFLPFVVRSQVVAKTQSVPQKPRIVITTDPELDDLNSLLRFLLYSTDFQIEGLIYASSQFHWKGDGRGTKLRVPGREYTRFGLDMCPCESWRWNPEETFIHDAVDAYAQVYENLIIHHREYPNPEVLRSKIRYGNIEFDGDISKDTPGSGLIRELILDKQSGPLYLSAWGGHSTIARALKSIQDEFQNGPQWTQLQAQISQKVILLPSGDQDNTYETYIQPNWPNIPYHQVQDGSNYGFTAPLGASTQDSLYLTAEWTQNYVSSKGPIGEMYRVWGDGKQMVKNDIFDFFGVATEPADALRKKGYVVWMPIQEPGAFISEGDTGTFMNLLNNGLAGGTYPEFGGWGGRIPPGKGINDPFANGPDVDAALLQKDTAGNSSELFKQLQQRLSYFPALQRDFAARMHWSVTPGFADANHNPQLEITGTLPKKINGENPIIIQYLVSDPDGDSVHLRYHLIASNGEIMTSGKKDNAHLDNELVIAKPTAAPLESEYHLILEARDNNDIPLSKYQHLIINFEGK